MAKIPHPDTSFAPIIATLDRRIRALETAAFQSLGFVGTLNGINASVTAQTDTPIASTSITLTRPGNVLALGQFTAQVTGGSYPTGYGYVRISMAGQESGYGVISAANSSDQECVTVFVAAINLAAGTYTLEALANVAAGLTLHVNDGTVNAFLIGP